MGASNLAVQQSQNLRKKSDWEMAGDIRIMSTVFSVVTGIKSVVGGRGDVREVAFVVFFLAIMAVLGQCRILICFQRMLLCILKWPTDEKPHLFWSE